MVPTGAVLAGKYRVERVLGQGGMGVVVRATHLQLHQPVAVKFLLPEVLTNPEVVQRFLREAQAVVRLKSEHVARVIDVGSLDEGAPYMVLEYLDGTDLADFPRQQLTIGQVVDLMLQACEALAEAHALGIVHRDLKPANFFITRRSDGSRLLKVLDFGISKAQQTALEQNLTAPATVMGTPAYMSPEQMRSSHNVDNRSDIWALGVVLYELLQGAPPFAADTFGSMAIKVVTEPLPPLVARLPRGLAEIVYRCLEKDPDRRFQNVAELARVLARHAQSTAQAVVSVERTSRVLGTEPPRSPSTLRSSAGAITELPRSGHRLPFAVGAAVVLGALVAVGIVLSHGDDKAAGSGLTFQAKTDYPTGASPQAVAVADVSGDDHPDLVVVNNVSDTVSVLLGNGNGTFQTRVDYLTGAGPRSIAIADVSGDGKPDLVVANGVSGTVSVLLANGNGAFHAKVDYRTGAGPRSVAVVDVDGDSKPDLVLANNVSNTLSVLRGNGDGTFQARIDYSSGSAPFSIAVADVSGDDKPDLVVVNRGSSTVSVLLNNGNGTFQARVDYSTGSAPLAVVVRDLSGDGKSDLVVVNGNDSAVNVLLGNGNGTFRAKVDYPTGGYSSSVAVADVSSDGKADLVVAGSSSDTVSVLLGNGDGTFQAEVDYPTGSDPSSVAVADVSSDGNPDLVVANVKDSTVSVLLAVAPQGM